VTDPVSMRIVTRPGALWQLEKAPAARFEFAPSVAVTEPA